MIFSLGYPGKKLHLFGLRMLQLAFRPLSLPFLYMAIIPHKGEPIAPRRRKEKGHRRSPTQLTQARAGVTLVRY